MIIDFFFLSWATTALFYGLFPYLEISHPVPSCSQELDLPQFSHLFVTMLVSYKNKSECSMLMVGDQRDTHNLYSSLLLKKKKNS